MRCSRCFVASLFAGLLAACAQRAEAAAGDGVLVLEVGGDGASLRAALRSAGVEPAAPAVVAALGDAPGAGDGRLPEAVRSAPVPAPRAPAPPPNEEPSWFTVTLADGQTPIHLARKHLGDGNRFREILALNGWDENDARRLQPGQAVKIPRAAGASARR